MSVLSRPFVRPGRRTLVRAGIVLVALAALAAAAAVARGAGSSPPQRPGLIVAGGILASPTSANGCRDSRCGRMQAAGVVPAPAG